MTGWFKNTFTKYPQFCLRISVTYTSSNKKTNFVKTNII
ncbi:hypothetical protein CHRYSEO8AT_450044 [Chryseobacterium sp. 8AT]|nr:hypothetical protein CHRYSEO8AT_450044 [Chryseobacterium sp. 8AT]